MLPKANSVTPNLTTSPSIQIIGEDEVYVTEVNGEPLETKCLRGKVNDDKVDANPLIRIGAKVKLLLSWVHKTSWRC